MTGHWPHEVEIKLERTTAAERLRRIEAWCTVWQIGFRVLAHAARELVRILKSYL